MYTYIRSSSRRETDEMLIYEPFGSFSTEVPVTALTEMFIIFLILTQIPIYH